MGKASLPKTPINDTLDANKERKKQFGRERAAFSRVPFYSTSIGSGTNSNSNSSVTSVEGLSTAGGTMMGPIAFYPQSQTISNGIINVSSQNAYSSRVVINGQSSASDDLEVILGASHAGQILFFEPVTMGQTITLQDFAKTATAWATGTSYSIGDVRLSGSRRYTCYVAHTSSSSTQPISGSDWSDKWYRNNIHIPGATEKVVQANEIILLQYDESSNVTWTLVSGGGSGSGMTNPATAQLDMAAFSIKGAWGGTANVLGIESDLDIGANYIQVDDTTSTLVGTVPANERRIFSDSNNNSELSVKKSDGSVVSLEGGGADTSLSNLTSTGEAHFANPTLSNLNSTGEAHFAAPTLSNLGTTSLNAQLNLNSQRIINTDWLSFNSTSTPSSGLAVYTDTADVWVRNASGAVNLTTGLLTTSANNTFTGTNYFDTTASGSTTSAPIKFQGDGNNTAQRVLEIGKYGAHGVQFIGEILGDTGRSMTNPDGGSDIPVPGTNEPAITIKAAMIMNTYTMYDLDTLVFSQGVSSTTPPPENDWVYIEANTGSSGSPNLTGMTYNVPTNKSHQFKINGSHVASIDSSGLNANDIGNGTVAAARLGTGSSITSKFLRGDNTWQSVSGGGSAADLDLSNLTTTSINQSLIPSSDNSKDLGTSSIQWRNLYIDGTAYLDAIGFGSYSMSLPTTNGTNGQVLTTNGSSALSWETPSSGSSGATVALDNLSSPTLNTNINANSKNINTLSYIRFNPSGISTSGVEGQMWYDGSNFKASTSTGSSFIIGSGGSSWNGNATTDLDMNSNSIDYVNGLTNDGGSFSWSGGGSFQVSSSVCALYSSNIYIGQSNDDVGFFGANPVGKQYIPPNASLANIVAALRNLGLGS